MAETLVNDAVCTLSAQLLSSTGGGGTISVASPGAPTGAVGQNARVRIGTEIVLVTVTTATSWTIVTRAVEDSDRYPAATWPAGTGADFVLTSAAVAVLGRANTFTQAQSAPGAGATSERWGAGSASSADFGVAVGNSASATGTAGVAVGYLTVATQNSIAIGNQATTAAGQSSVAVGATASATGTFGVVLGFGSTTAKRAVLLGAQLSSAFDDSIAIGPNAVVAASGDVAISANGSTPTALYQRQSSTSTTRNLFELRGVTISNTDASRKYGLRIFAYDTAAREGFRVEADGSAALLGFYGATAVAKASVTGSRAGNAALASLLTALANLGLITDSTTA